MRDLLLGREPKDFDIATNATPEQVRATFRNCRLIGRRFRLAHVHFGREIIEVATFRGMEDPDQDGSAKDERLLENGRILRDNVYGTIEEDALRRDFTVNSLYYNIEDFSVIDYTDGLGDLREGVLRLLGDPETRYREDPVRMLRAVRFAAKLGFRIDPGCEQPLFEDGDMIRNVPPARLFDEVLKLFMGGTALQCFEKLRHYQLFGHLFPETEESLSHEEQDFPITFVNRGMHNTDVRIREEKPVTPAFLFAVLLWEPARTLSRQLQDQGESVLASMQQAGSQVIGRQVQLISIPRRFSTAVQEIWNLQHRFEQRAGKRPQRLVTHPRFRAAYDFLLLRAESGEADMELAQWWTDFQELDEAGRNQLKGSNKRKTGGKRRRRRRPRKRATEPGDA